MAHTKSAVKRARQNGERRARNRSGSSQIKTATDHLAKAIAGKDKAQTATMLSSLHSTLDKCAKQGVITRNTATRLKTRATERVRKAAAA